MPRILHGGETARLDDTRNKLVFAFVKAVADLEPNASTHGERRLPDFPGTTTNS